MDRLEIYKEAVAWLIDGGADPDDTYVYENYSGRNMYGATVPGIVTDNPVAAGAAIAVVILDNDPFADAFDVEKNLPERSDSMGRFIILY